MGQYHISKMRAAGHATARVLDYITPFVVENVSTEYLDKLCYDYITRELAACAANIGYNGFPKTICTSLNEVICHGIPKPQDILKNGDIINIDVALKLNGYYGDASRMFAVGHVTPKAADLISHTKTALDLAIKTVKPNADISDIGIVILNYAKKHNLGVVYNYCGHGIGKKYHMWPNIPHCAVAASGILMKPGMIFTIEPMLTAGVEAHNHILEDSWTVVTDNNELSAQWEHTVLVTDSGVEILTV